MSLNDIKDNIDKLNEKSNEELIRYIHELLILHKKKDNKLESLKTELRYLNRHMIKIRDNIDRSLKTKMKNDATWESITPP